ncbi:MAG: hypothetical protein RSC04_02295 [Bacteroidales bacterium]
MKNIIKWVAVLTGFFFSLSALSAQNLNQSPTNVKSLGQGIVLTVIIPQQQDPFPQGANTYLSNKLIQAAVANGVAAGPDFSRFFITAQFAMLSKDIVAGPPQQIALNMEVTLYIADYFDQKIYSSVTMNVKGVGTNETKCFINALKSINVNSPILAQFMDEGKTKIINYYKSQCANIIKRANSLAAQKKYEEAIYVLTSVPDACGECYDLALASTATIYQQYVDRLCDINFAKAQAAWAAEQNSAGAASAGNYLSQIYPDAKCYAAGQDLYREIKNKVLDDWKFEMKKWQDGVDLESQRIAAMRDVGVAFGKGQQPTTYVLGWLRP